MKKLLSLLVASVLVLTACDNRKEEKAENGKPTVKFAALYPMSGDGAIYGQTAQKVTKMFLDDFMKNNPNSKYNYEVIFENVEFSAAKTANAVQKVVNIDKVNAMFAMTSSSALIMNPVAEKNEVIQLSYAVDPKVANGKYNFTISTSIKKIAEMTVAKMKKDNVKKAATISLASDVASLKATKMIEEEMQKHGIENAGSYMVNPQDRDFAIILMKISNQNPDIIIMEGLPPVTDLIFRQMKKMNINIPVTGAWTISSLGDKSLAEGYWYVDDGQPTQDFIDEFAQRVGTAGTHYGEYFYTMLTGLTNAFENTKSLKGQLPRQSDVVETMMRQTQGLTTALGKLDINREGEIGLNGVYKMIKNGEQVLIQ